MQSFENAISAKPAARLRPMGADTKSVTFLQTSLLECYIWKDLISCENISVLLRELCWGVCVICYQLHVYHSNNSGWLLWTCDTQCGDSFKCQHLISNIWSENKAIKKKEIIDNPPKPSYQWRYWGQWQKIEANGQVQQELRGERKELILVIVSHITDYCLSSCQMAARPPSVALIL